MYKDITTVEKIFETQKDNIDIKKVEEALSFLPKKFSSGMIALLTLQAGCEVVNNDVPEEPEFKPDYNNTNQQKWTPWYVGGDESGSGFQFYVSVSVWTYSNANGGARLALKDEPRTNHMNEHFQEVYKNLWLVLKQ